MEMDEDGTGESVETICAARPDLIPAVLRGLGTGRRLRILEDAGASSDAYRGRVLSERYRLDERIGSGAMGVIYRAHDLELDRPIAIKVLRALLIDGPQAEERFDREARALAKVQHPAIVPIFDRGRTEEGEPFLVMELLNGRSLHDIITEQGDEDHAQEAVDLRRLVTWTAEVCSGLGAAHAARIMHRDVKPSNIFIREDGGAVLVDFGIAASLKDGRITAEGSALGTPAYTSPESLSSRSEPHPSADVYGLTATLYHALSLRQPYTGTPSGVLAQVVTRDPEPIGKLRPDLSPDLQAVVARGMARSVRDRYSSAFDLERDLRAFLEHRPVVARPLPIWLKALRRFQCSRPLQAATGVALLAIALAVGFQLSGALHARSKRLAFEARASVPANFSIVAPSNRRATNDKEREATTRALDRWVKYSDGPLPSRVLRASFRFDHGDARGAEEDMQAVARFVGTPYARGLLESYGRVESSDEKAVLEIDGLPEPESPEDAYLAGYHGLRALDYGAAAKYLGDERLHEVPYAEELAILLGMARTAEARQRSLELESMLGGRTAQSAHLLGTTLIFRRQYEFALDVYLEGIELSPESYVLYENAGVAAWRAGLYDRGEQYFQRAIELRPHNVKPYENCVHMFLEAKDIARAEAVRARMEAAVGDEGAAKAAHLKGHCEATRSIIASRNGETDRSIEAAMAAVQAFDAARQLDKSLRVTELEIIGRKIADNDMEGLANSLLRHAITDPLNDFLLTHVLDLPRRHRVELDPDLLLDYLDAIRGALGERASLEQKRLEERFPKHALDAVERD